MIFPSRMLALSAAALSLAAIALPAKAALLLNATGAARFSLTTFADNMPSRGDCGSPQCGPLGIATTASGNVLVSDIFGDIYSFADVDGQHGNLSVGSLNGPLAKTNHGSAADRALVRAGGDVYASGTAFNLTKLSDDGTIATNFLSGAASLGLWRNPVNGHILSAANNSGQNIRDINVTGPTQTTVPGGLPTADGVSVSPDGTVVYLATGGQIRGFRISDGVNVMNSNIFDSYDGTGVIQNGPHAGDLIANTNSGNLYEIDPVTGIATLIASGGSRGDFVGVDSNNGSLFISQSNSILRLSCNDCVFETPVPEPATLALLGSSLVGLAVLRRRRQFD